MNQCAGSDDKSEIVEALKSLTGERSVRSLALKLDMHQATLNRQILGAGVPLDVCVNIARGYGVNLLDVIAAVGAINPREARAWRSVQIEDFEAVELAGELYRRMGGDTR